MFILNHRLAQALALLFLGGQIFVANAGEEKLPPPPKGLAQWPVPISIKQTPPQSVYQHFQGYHQSTDYTCGPSAALMVIKALLGSSPSESELALIFETDSSVGTHPFKLAKHLREDFGLAAEYRTHLDLVQLRQHMQIKNSAVILDLMSEGEGHYVVLTHIDQKWIYFLDPWPWVEDVHAYKLSISDFLATWYDRHTGKLYKKAAILIHKKSGAESLD